MAKNNKSDELVFKLVPRPLGSAESILARLVASFPGLMDGEQDVNGGDVVDFLTREFDAIYSESPLGILLMDRFLNGSPGDDRLNEAGYKFPQGRSGAQ